MSFSLSDSTLKEHLEAIFESVSRFATSADVVIKASGLRIEAIRAIAREQGIEIENVESRCIDENLLSLLADAHVRRLKSYFNNSKRHIAELSGAELSTFVDFCKTFKKHLSNDHAALSWDDIDTNAIREQFIRKVKKLTPASSEFDEIHWNSQTTNSLTLIHSCKKGRGTQSLSESFVADGYTSNQLYTPLQTKISVMKSDV